MATRDQRRLEDDRTQPLLLSLWRALQPLRSVLRFMQSGAHPDDESSAMLAALALRDGLNISYTCSTRGEGGQNDIGTEAGAALGALRTREMERACDILGMRMYWLSETPDDPITDFGFSKSGDETFRKWGEDRTLARFVEIVRTERPDILCPTFLDVPGQHGHHRAMTRAAHDVMKAAADPSFPSNLPPWTVSKLYLPAWSGAGQAYDDDLPPPPATLVVDGSGTEPVSGWNWERIGQHSRAFHRTQGMGRWTPAGVARDWPLHLALSFVEGPDRAVQSGLPATLADLARLPGAESLSGPLEAAHRETGNAIKGFPELDKVADAAARALEQVRRADEDCPEAVRPQISHRLAAKEVQLAHVLRLSLGIGARAGTGDIWLEPGQATGWSEELDPGRSQAAKIIPDLPIGWERHGDRLEISDDALPHDGYRAHYDPISPSAPAIRLDFSHRGVSASARLELDPPPVLLPRFRAAADPEKLVVNRRTGRDQVAIRLQPDTASVKVPHGWGLQADRGNLRITPAPDVTAGLFRMPVGIGATPAMSVQRIEHDHVAPTCHSRPAEIAVRVLDISVPAVHVGYIGAGNDRVGHWLRAIGAKVTDIDDAELTSDDALARFDTIVIGIFAMRFRRGLSDATGRIRRWTEAGGTLVTLYHRPWDNWDPDKTPPRRLEIGQPSLRWRVTDETAEVRHIADHPILRGPNPVTPDTWSGWVKERGLYFAKSWDDAYTPLIELSDPGEPPLQGALLVADIGLGRHVHASLILHHQMENLVPGAFALMANLIARRE